VSPDSKSILTKFQFVFSSVEVTVSEAENTLLEQENGVEGGQKFAGIVKNLQKIGRNLR